MEMTDRHQKAILKMFSDLLKSAKVDERKAVFDEFRNAFLGCFGYDFTNIINNAFKENNVPSEIIEEWNTYEKDQLRQEEFPTEICPMVPEDEDEILHLLIRELEIIPQMSKFCETGTVKEFSKTGYSFVAKINGVIIGVMMAQKILDWGRDTIFINNFAVESSLQGKGIGTQMLEYLKELARKDCKCDLARIKLGTNKNRKAYDIYHKWGFTDQDNETIFLDTHIATGYSRRK